MKWQKEKLDVILVPAGLCIMFAYHIFLLYRYLRNAKYTVLGFHNHCQKAWVKKLMQIDAMSRGPAFTVMNSTIVAANFMASTSLTLSSLIGAWIGSSSINGAVGRIIYFHKIDAMSRGPAFTAMSNTIISVNFMATTSLTLSSLIGAWIGSSSSNELVGRIIYGDTELPINSIKYISIFLFFLLAFASFIQSSRCYVQANLLISMPKAEIPLEFVVEALVHGGNFWQVGLRAIYFAITMLMWMFGPIPMFLSSVATVTILYVLDANKKHLHDFNESCKKEGKRKIAVDRPFEQQEMANSNYGLQATAITTAVLSAAVAS